jgi:hypothetical protein
MIELLRKRRNTNELGLLHPAFMLQFAGVVRDLEAAGFRPRLQETYRNPVEQEKKFREGKSQIRSAGPHTNVILMGPGKTRPASFATHVLDDSAKNPADPGNLWVARLAILAGKYRLASGCVWSQTASSPLAPGKPHRIALEAAIAAGDEALTKKLLDEARGFDILHIEVRGWKRFYGVEDVHA